MLLNSNNGNELSKAYVGRLVILGLTALLDGISVYIGPSPRKREIEERTNRGE